jgi:hypothetical protein
MSGFAKQTHDLFIQQCDIYIRQLCDTSTDIYIRQLCDTSTDIYISHVWCSSLIYISDHASHRTGARGGELFQAFAAGFGCWKLHDAFMKASETGHLNKDFWKRQSKEHTHAFATFIITRLAEMGNQARHQLFHNSMLLNFRGLSKSGQDFMSQFGCVMGTSTFWRYKEKAIKRHGELTRSGAIAARSLTREQQLK